jgi:hypothetical protein
MLDLANVRGAIFRIFTSSLFPNICTVVCIIVFLLFIKMWDCLILSLLQYKSKCVRTFPLLCDDYYVGCFSGLQHSFFSTNVMIYAHGLNHSYGVQLVPLFYLSANVVKSRFATFNCYSKGDRSVKYLVSHWKLLWTMS